jgi:hypothetical protein
MKKFITSIFLILALVTSGLVGFTPTASAINKSAVRCDFLGQYINPTATGNPCQPCPENNYCPLVSGTQIENCATKGYPDSDCKESRKIFSIDKSIPCPSATFTKGYTYNTLQGTRITTDGDLFPVGQGATDESMCKAPDFKCPAATPVLLKGIDGVAKCYPTNTCNADQVAILKNGIPDCSVACKSDILVSGKCYPICPKGEYLDITTVTNDSNVGQDSISSTTVCKKIVVLPTKCPIAGQIATNPIDLSSCACVAGQVLSAEKTNCITPIVPCTPPLTGNQPNCVVPPTVPCPDNKFGYSEPNCTPCPNNGTNKSPNNIDSSSCKIPVVPCTPPATGNQPNCTNPVPCPVNTFGAGQPNCQQCPVNSTSQAGTTVASGCVAQNNGGGEGFCGGWWAIACGAAVIGGACLLKVFGFCAGGDSTPGPSTQTTTTQIEKVTPTTRRDKLLVKKITTNGISDCPDVSSRLNSELANDVFRDNGNGEELSDAHYENQSAKTGDKYLWVATYAVGNTTKVMSTIRPAGGSTGTSSSAEEVNAKPYDSSLLCLMKRFAKLQKMEIGSERYMSQLKGFGILHGLNKQYKLECLNLSNLETAIANFGEKNSEAGGVKYIVSNETQGYDYSEVFDTESAAIAFAKETVGKTSKKVNVVNVETNELKLQVEGRPDISNTAEATYEPQSFFNLQKLFGTVNAAAAVDLAKADDTNPSGNGADLLIASANTGSTEDALAEIVAEIYGDGEEDSANSGFGDGTNKSDDACTIDENSPECAAKKCAYDESFCNVNGPYKQSDTNNNGKIDNTCVGFIPSWVPGCKTEGEKLSESASVDDRTGEKPDSDGYLGNGCDIYSPILYKGTCYDKSSFDEKITEEAAEKKNGYGDGTNSSDDACSTDENSAECAAKKCAYDESFCNVNGPYKQSDLESKYTTQESTQTDAYCMDKYGSNYKYNSTLDQCEEKNDAQLGGYYAKYQCESEGKVFDDYLGCIYKDSTPSEPSTTSNESNDSQLGGYYAKYQCESEGKVYDDYLGCINKAPESTTPTDEEKSNEVSVETPSY